MDAIRAAGVNLQCATWTKGGDYSRDSWEIYRTVIDWDGNCFESRTPEFAIPAFKDAMAISNLGIFPFHLHPSVERVKKELIELERSLSD